MLKYRWMLACWIIPCVVIASYLINQQPPSLTSEPSSLHIQGVTMPAVVIREPLTLYAWEEDPNLPPVGMPPDPNRPISYAWLNVTFENTTLDHIELKIKSVTVCSSENGKVLQSLPESTLTLGPLEISPQQYRMFSQQSYGQNRTVVGSLTYELNGQTYTLTTDVVPVQ
jgi:hypothetical protein